MSVERPDFKEEKEFATFRVWVDEKPGELTVRYRANGSLEGSSRLPSIIGGGKVNPLRITVTPESVSEFYNSLESEVEGLLTDRLGVPSTVADNVIEPSVPSAFNGVVREPINLETSFAAAVFGGVKTSGESPVSGMTGFTFPTATIPQIPGVPLEDIVERVGVVPKLRITISNNVGIINWKEDITFTEEIEPSNFVKTKPIDELGCDQFFPNTSQAIAEAQAEVTDITGQVNTLESRFQSLLNNIGSAVGIEPAEPKPGRRGIGGGGGGGGITIDQLKNASFENVDTGELRDFIARAREFDVRVQGLEQAQSAVDKAKSLVAQKSFGPCSSQLRTVVSGPTANLQEARNSLDELRSQKEELLSLLEQPGLIPCAQAFSSLANEISTFKAQLGMESGPVPANPPNTFDEAVSMLKEARKLKARAEDIQRPECSDKFVSETERVISRLQSIKNQIGINCVERNPQVAEDLSSLEEKLAVGGGTPTIEMPPSASTISNIEQEISRARTNVQTVENSQCVTEFKQRLSDITSRLDELRGEVPVNCVEKYPDINNSIESLERQVGIGTGTKTLSVPIRPTILTEKLNDVSNVESRVVNEVTESSCVKEFTSRLSSVKSELRGFEKASPTKGLGCSDVSRSIRNRVTGFKTGADLFIGRPINKRTQSKKDSLIREGNQLLSDIRSNVSDENQCKEQLTNTVDTALGFVKAAPVAAETGGETPPGDLDCNDVTLRLRNRVGSFQSAVEQFAGRSRSRRGKRKKEDLIQEGKEVKEDVNDDVKDANPCKQELLSRVNNSLGTLRSLGTRTEADIPCSARHSNIDSRMDSFQSDVLELSAPVSPSTVQQFARRGDRLRRTIEQNGNISQECKRQFGGRISRLVRRVGNLTQRVTVEKAEGGAGPGAQRSEALKKLLSQAEQLGNGEGNS